MDETKRDIAQDMTEITSRLGEPEATYQSNVRSMAWRFAVGVVIVLGAAALHYFVWTGGIPAFKLRHLKAWILLGLAMTVGPATGLYLIYFAVRGMKMWVLQYPTGLFVWHRGVVYALPWNEIASVLLRGLPNKAELQQTTHPDRPPSMAYYSLARSIRRLFGTELVLIRDDGATVSLLSILNDFPTLGELIQQRIYEEQFELLWDRLQSGETIPFADVACSLEQLDVGEESIKWREIKSIDRHKNKYQVKSNVSGKQWGEFDLEKVPNLHIMMSLAQYFIAQHTNDEV